MSTGSHTHHHYPLHERIERALGADIRLIYGIGVPMIAVLGFIIALAVSGQGWMVGAVVVFLLIALAVVVFGLYGMLNEDSDDEQRSS